MYVLCVCVMCGWICVFFSILAHSHHILIFPSAQGLAREIVTWRAGQETLELQSKAEDVINEVKCEMCVCAFIS